MSRNTQSALPPQAMQPDAYQPRPQGKVVSVEDVQTEAPAPSIEQLFGAPTAPARQVLERVRMLVPYGQLDYSSIGAQIVWPTGERVLLRPTPNGAVVGFIDKRGISKWGNMTPGSALPAFLARNAD